MTSSLESMVKSLHEAEMSESVGYVPQSSLNRYLNSTLHHERKEFPSFVIDSVRHYRI